MTTRAVLVDDEGTGLELHVDAEYRASGQPGRTMRLTGAGLAGELTVRDSTVFGRGNGRFWEAAVGEQAAGKMPAEVLAGRAAEVPAEEVVLGRFELRLDPVSYLENDAFTWSLSASADGSRELVGSSAWGNVAFTLPARPGPLFPSVMTVDGLDRVKVEFREFDTAVDLPAEPDDAVDLTASDIWAD
ncbi:hypothetical protein [Yinghuangia soli]|uniref:Uncharacterized protein n=1 Tax=Yinghuangia soli TaxID=2908204 RepID=A0AA41U4N0_9ACTN|nr:hypothetical protein [Yinghuangia soli]MCF2533116.1 hypothetical protein [Yinghuangia soli]